MIIDGIKIEGIELDSRKVKKNFLFADCNDDKYVETAIENGATVIICSTNFNNEHTFPNIHFIKKDNPSKYFANIAASFYPKQPKNICAITGTNGKTSIADFIRQVLVNMNIPAASIGTLGLIKNNDPAIERPNTTPNAIIVHKELDELANDNIDFVAIEMSSHGLEQNRVSAVKVGIAGFTNLTRDHLDYHKTMQSYLDAKKILFTENLIEGGYAILNADIDVFEELKNTCKAENKNVISYGYKGTELKLLNITPKNNGQILSLEFFGDQKEVFIPLAGEFQAYNALCAIAMLYKLTNDNEDVLKHIENIKGACGRLELIAEHNGGTIYVDYAHTPDALENVLKAMRKHTKAKLYVVFGCGGNRDAGKRPIMGKIAHDIADVCYVTDDNPRFEDPTLIRQEIINQCPNAFNIADRKIAIENAISKLQNNDVLVIAGKGHEIGQYIKGETIHFSDQETIIDFINK